MKPSSRPSRTPSRLSTSVRHQLSLYALAAGAAGVLTLAQPSEAKIVYKKTHVVIGGYWLDLNPDGIHNFWLGHWMCGTATVVDCISLSGVSRGYSSIEVKHEGTHTWARALHSGARIPAGSFQWFAQLVSGRGPWYNVKNRYLGLKFRFKGKTHYGWARMSVLGTLGNLTATLTGYAYETIPNKPIIAGKTKGLDVITVEPGSLGRLAQGSAGRLGR
jgi:hypothetical protein